MDVNMDVTPAAELNTAAAAAAANPLVAVRPSDETVIMMMTIEDLLLYLAHSDAWTVKETFEMGLTGLMVKFHTKTADLIKWLVDNGREEEAKHLETMLREQPPLSGKSRHDQLMTYMVNVGMLVNLMKEHVKYIMTTQASSLNLEQVNMLTAFSFLYSAYYSKTVEIMKLLVRVLTENKTLAALIGENKKADTYAGVLAGGASETPTPTAPSDDHYHHHETSSKYPIKCKAPELFSYKDNPESWLMTWNTWYEIAHVHTDTNMKSKILMLNLDKGVRENLRNMFTDDESFWKDVTKISDALLSVYAKPNEKAEARSRLMQSQMQGCKLGAYYRSFIKNASLAGVHVNEKHWFEVFFEGINASAIPHASLKVAIIGTYHSSDATIFELYKAADEVLRIQYGAGYENKRAFSNADKVSSNRDHDSRKNKYNGNKNGAAVDNKKRKAESDANAGARKYRKAPPSDPCERCGCEYHLTSKCSAMYKWENGKRTNKILPIKTARKFIDKDPEWVSGRYPGTGSSSYRNRNQGELSSKKKANAKDDDASIDTVQVLMDVSGREGNFKVRDIVHAGLIHANVQTKKTRASRQLRVAHTDTSHGVTVQRVIANAITVDAARVAVDTCTSDVTQENMDEAWDLGDDADTTSNKRARESEGAGAEYRPEGNSKAAQRTRSLRNKDRA